MLEVSPLVWENCFTEATLTLLDQGKTMTSAATELQNRVISDAENSLNAGRDAVIDAPTGSGKSRAFTKLAENGYRRGEKTIILSGRHKHAEGAIDNIKEYADPSITTSIGKLGVFDDSGSVVSTTVQTANLNIEKIGKYDRIIIDEAHHAKSDNTDYERLLDHLTKVNPDAKIIAVSATFPEEMKGMNQRISKADRHIITFEEAVATKLIYLPDTEIISERLKNHKTVEQMVEEQRRSAPESTQDMVGEKIRKQLPDDWMTTMAWHYDRRFREVPTISFFDTIPEAEAFAKELKDFGIEAQTVHSRRKPEDNNKTFDDFESGRIKGLISVDMISEGYNVDARGLFLGKLKTSIREYRQIIGRGARGFGQDKEENTLFVDMGASTYLHGNIAAQADISDVKSRIIGAAKKAIDLIPESEESRVYWKKLPTMDGYATATKNGVVYAIPNKDGYIAFESMNDRKGTKVKLLDIEGQKKGRPSREAFRRWTEGAIRTSEKFITRAISQTGGIEALIAKDWQMNGDSIRQNIALMTQPVMAMNHGSMAR